jgi:hypothetical protein
VDQVPASAMMDIGGSTVNTVCEKNETKIVTIIFMLHANSISQKEPISRTALRTERGLSQLCQAVQTCLSLCNSWIKMVQKQKKTNKKNKQKKTTHTPLFSNYPSLTPLPLCYSALPCSIFLFLMFMLGINITVDDPSVSMSAGMNMLASSLDCTVTQMLFGRGNGYLQFFYSATKLRNILPCTIDLNIQLNMYKEGMYQSLPFPENFIVTAV